MIKISLYSAASVFRIARKARDLPENYKKQYYYNYSEGVLWLDGAYIRFYPNLIVINIFNPVHMPKNNVEKMLSYLLINEEVYIDGWENSKKYISQVDQSTFIERSF